MHAHPLEPRVAHVEGALDQVNERLGGIERRLDSMDARFNWVIGTIVGSWITLISAQIATMLTIVFHR
jgi:tetrahydromethanopterin S-methyltransferase subunit G